MDPNDPQQVYDKALDNLQKHLTLATSITAALGSGPEAQQVREVVIQEAHKHLRDYMAAARRLGNPNATSLPPR